MHLYEIADEYRRIDDLLTENGGEITDEIQAAIDGIEGALEAKIDAIGSLIREAMAEHLAYHAEKVRLHDRADAAVNRANALKAYLLHHLKAAGVPKVKGALFSARQATASTPSIKWDVPGTAPPADFRRTIVELDGARAREAYKAGTLPAGFRVSFTEYLDLR